MIAQRFFTGLAMGCIFVLQDFADTLPESEKSSELLSAKYRVIVRRNPFNLQDPAPPPEVKEEPKEELPLEELELTLAGVSAKNGERRVWISMTLPSSQPAQETERFFGLRENEQQHGITVKAIQSNGEVEIEYDGAPHLLSFKTHGNKKKEKKDEKRPDARAARSSVPSRFIRGRSGNLSRTRTSSPRGTSRRGSYSVRDNSSRSSSNQQRLTRDEQVLSLEAQRIIAEKEGRFLPPVPELHLRNSGR